MPYFRYDQLRDGNFLCFEHAYMHLFLDGTIGFRIDDAKDVHIMEPWRIDDPKNAHIMEPWRIDDAKNTHIMEPWRIDDAKNAHIMEPWRIDDPEDVHTMNRKEQLVLVIQWLFLLGCVAVDCVVSRATSCKLALYLWLRWMFLELKSI